MAREDTTLRKLSPEMRKACALAKRGGLVRRSGGYWIAVEDAPAFEASRHSVEHVGTQTVAALESRGVLTVEPGYAPVWRRRRTLAQDPAIASSTPPKGPSQ